MEIFGDRFFSKFFDKKRKNKSVNGYFFVKTKQKNIAFLKNLEFHLETCAFYCIGMVCPFDLMKEDIEEDCWNLEAQRETVTPL